MAPAPSSPGNAAADPRTRVLGDFELIERIGQGSMGVVFKARQRSMDRIVAIKVLKPSLAHDEGYVTRFAREAQAAARLSHPNIVLAIDAGEKSGCRYFAMEYVEGHSVGLLLKAGPLEEQLALAITVQVARALDYAWSRERIVHRDIKPGNIIITPDGIAKLADLGLAHDADIGDEESFSKGGRILGTPFYISPEQIRRLPELDVRCDIYGLGATLYHMVTGQPPYKGGATKAVLARHLHEPPPDPRKVDRKISPAMARIIARCMATQREDRYPDAAALVADVEAILLPEGKRDAPTHRGRRVHRRPRASSPVPIFLTCLALVAFGIFALILASRSKSTPPPPPKVEAPQPQFPEAEKAYHGAAAFAEANPRKLVEAIARLQRVERDHGESPFAALAAQGRAALEGNLERRATAALVSLRVSADASISAGKYTQALAVFEKFPQEITNDAWRSRVEAEREIVLRKAREAFGKALAAANATPDIEARIQALGAIQASLPAAWQAERDKALAAAQAELAERVDQERQRDVHILQGLYAQLKRLYAQRDYPRAQAAIQAALADAPEAVRPVLRRELAEAKAMPAVWGAAEKGAKSLIGKPYVLRGIPGTLVKVAAGQLTTKTLGGTFTADIHSLPRPQIVALI
ncbi:serine/threonine protein kinase, partial [bacterium]|nr:serine/threonine protein kinase [bacterium]